MSKDYHIHTIEVPDEKVLEEIKKELKYNEEEFRKSNGGSDDGTEHDGMRNAGRSSNRNDIRSSIR